MNYYQMRTTTFILMIALFASCTKDVRIGKKAPVDYVDMFMGSGDDYGQNDPAACVPYGMVKLCPDSDPPNHAGYNFEEPRISGVSINRISGVGSNGKGGSLRIKPCTGDYIDEVRIVKETEEAVPGYYATKLDNGITMRLTATNNVGIEEFAFPENSAASLVIDLHSTFIEFNAASFREIAKDEVSGMVSSRRGKGNVYVQYFNIKSNVAFDAIEQDSNLVYLTFNEAPKEKVELRVAVSAIDEETATKENIREKRSFDEIKDDAYSLWAERLAKIELEGNEEYKTIFYSSLYRNFLTPVNVTSLDGTFLALDGKIEKADGFTYYSSWSTWDTYRTKFPLMTIVENDLFSDIYRSQVEMLGKTKKIWPTPTVRNDHAILVMADAFAKDIPGVDLNKYYDILKRGKDKMPDSDPGGNLENAYDVWAFAQIAKKLEHKDDYEKYMEISKDIWERTWKEKFMEIDPATFDTVHGGGLYEGTLWQYRWSVPFDIDGLIQIGGGKEKLAGQLEYFFENNLYTHGNQPDIQAPFMFNVFGKPSLTQKWVNTILTKEMVHRYGTHDKFPTPYIGKTYKAEPRAFIPEMDDDDATMSAWYVLASMGIYPLTPGIAEYQISSPIFEKITLHLDNGNTFTIKCNNLSDENIYIQSVHLNGKNLPSLVIAHKDIMAGGELVFNLGREPVK